jgi:ketosteroid isomerase-like protein
MSQENVESVRHVYEALNEGADEPLLDFLHPAFGYRPGRRRGRASDRAGARQRRSS